jgi:polyisoprenoid-binding protein YceI
VSGTIIAPDGDFAAAEVHAVVETATIDTGDSQRDAHLKSAQFLDVESYPTMTFRSRRVERSRRDPAKYAMAGDLTLHGVTRTVILDAMFGGEVRDSWGNQRIGFTATSTISRKAFGLTWNELLESGGVAVGDDVMITIDTEIVAAPAAAASERGA